MCGCQPVTSTTSASAAPSAALEHRDQLRLLGARALAPQRRWLTSCRLRGLGGSPRRMHLTLTRLERPLVGPLAAPIRGNTYIGVRAEVDRGTGDKRKREGRIAA